jgi:hypothetical protein
MCFGRSLTKSLGSGVVGDRCETKSRLMWLLRDAANSLKWTATVRPRVIATASVIIVNDPEPVANNARFAYLLAPLRIARSASAHAKLIQKFEQCH